MKKILPLIFACVFVSIAGFAQVYVDNFDNDDPANTGGAAVFSSSESDGEWTIAGTNTGPWDVFTYEMHDQGTGTPIVVDATGNNKIFIRAKASAVGTQLRMDIQDADGFMTTNAGITKTLTTDYMDLEFDFSGVYEDGGFGGTACDAASAPCPVDGTRSARLVFYIDPGAGGFNGSVVIDYVAFGEEPSTEIMSDVFQNHFDSPNSLNGVASNATGWSFSQTGSEMVISGDGTLGQWDAIGALIINQTTWDTIDVDATGNNKIFVKIKSTQPNTAFRIDLQDIDGFATTQGSITKLVGTEYSVLEFDFTGVYADLGFGGTPCTMDTAPCPVDGTRISNMVLFIEPGVGEFLGEVTIDYISYGTSLEPAGSGPQLIYEDRFNDETITQTSDAPGFTVAEEGSDLLIMGDGSASPFAAISYILHDQDDASEVVIDMTPAKNKVVLKAKVDAGTVPLRVDVIDTTGLTSSFTALTKTLTEDYSVLEFDFSGATDGGYGGTPCDSTTAPCIVDLTAINQILLYPDAVQGGFNRTISIDYLSIGTPLGPDSGSGGPRGIVNYNDQMDDNTSVFISDVSGLVSSFGNDTWTITGDGSNAQWGSILYANHNDVGEPILANAVGSDNKLYIKAKASVADTELRIDLQDNLDYVTNANASSVMLSTDYVIYELNYDGKYLDGGFGGSPCTSDTAPCPVDGERVANLQFFVLPGVGGFNGTVDIEWISFGKSLDAVPAGVSNYQDEISGSTGGFITDPGGLTSTTTDVWTVAGDGTGGPWNSISYSFYNDAGDQILANSVGSNDKLFIRAKSSVDVDLRIDLQDVGGFFTNLNPVTQTIGADYEIYEYDFANAYLDGGFGGPCDPSSAPCPVDGERIATLGLFFAPGVGLYDGTFELDWLAFGSPLSGVTDANRLNSMRGFPNPVSNELNLEFDLVNAADVQLVVYNMLGAKVQIQNAGNRVAGMTYESINMSNLPNGIYTVQILADNAAAGTLRIIKE